MDCGLNGNCLVWIGVWNPFFSSYWWREKWQFDGSIQISAWYPRILERIATFCKSLIYFQPSTFNFYRFETFETQDLYFLSLKVLFRELPKCLHLSPLNANYMQQWDDKLCIFTFGILTYWRSFSDFWFHLEKFDCSTHFEDWNFKFSNYF